MPACSFPCPQPIRPSATLVSSQPRQLSSLWPSAQAQACASSFSLHPSLISRAHSPLAMQVYPAHSPISSKPPRCSVTPRALLRLPASSPASSASSATSAGAPEQPRCRASPTVSLLSLSLFNVIGWVCNYLYMYMQLFTWLHENFVCFNYMLCYNLQAVSV